MKFVTLPVLLLALATLTTPAIAQKSAAPPPAAKVDIEIYHIAPGQQEAFLRFIARCDEVNRAVGLPPRQLYVHSDGADWDYILIQPAETPPDKQAALDAAWANSGLPSGADFFFAMRRFIASHTDTIASGPTSAAAYLATSHRGEAELKAHNLSTPPQQAVQ
ncbi:MAG: hypothetical protein ABI268_12145 [Rhodanobacter sp.]